MRVNIGFLFLIFLTWLAACGPAAPVESPEILEESDLTKAPEIFMETPPALSTKAGGPAVPTDPMRTPPPLPEGYPVEPAPAPTPIEGYPAQSLTAPLVEAYPDNTGSDGFVWVIRPLGEQCADPDQSQYADLKEAVAGLTAAGITVGEAEMTNLMVCSACGCPTSVHFRIQVETTDVAAAESLGWERE